MNELYEQKRDAEIWADFQSGNYTAFAFIYEKYIQNVYNYGRQVSNDESLVEDCVQDLFIDLWNHKHKLSRVTSIRWYLHKAVQRKVKGALRLRRRYVADAYVLEKNAETVASGEALLIEVQCQEQRQKMLLRYLHQLPEKQKKALMLKFYENLSYQEIAEAMSLNIANVYKIIERALGTLRKEVIYLLVVGLPGFC